MSAVQYRIQTIQGVPYSIGSDSNVYMLPIAAGAVSLGIYTSETDTLTLNPSWKELAAPSLLAYRQRLGDYTQAKVKESPPIAPIRAIVEVKN